MYRVAGGNVKSFIDKFADFLEDKMLCFDRILLLGDFNISLNASRLWALLMEEFGLIQLFKSQTHKPCGLLDYHVIWSSEILINVISKTLLTQTDHSLICFSINNWKPSKPKQQMFYPNWKLFRPDLYLNSLLSNFRIEQASSVDKAWNDYLAAEENILHDQLQLKVKTIFDHKCPFCDDELLFFKSKKRKCERLYGKTQSVAMKADFDLTTKIYFDKFLEKRAFFINNVLQGKVQVKIMRY